jgi:hypothetical protein
METSERSNLEAAIAVVQDEEGAIEKVQHVKSEASEYGFEALEANCLNSLGEYTRAYWELESSWEYFLEYYQRMCNLSRVSSQATGALNLAKIGVATGRFEKANHYLERGESLLEKMGATEHVVGLRFLIRLGLAVGTDDESTFEECFVEIKDGWPDDWRIIEDNAFMLEVAGDLARDREWCGATVDLLELARSLWRQLDSPKSIERIDNRLQPSVKS